MFKIEVAVDGRWCPIGGTYASREEANTKVAQYLLAASSQRQPQYRVVRVSK